MRPHVLSARPFIVGVVLFFVILCQPLLADVTGTILGTVVDSSAAVVVGASVTLRNPDTGYIHSVKTDATGSFQFLSVPIGEGFVVEVEKPGFEKMFQSDIKLLVNQSYRVDFHLQVGKVSEGVTVSATSVQVESTSTQLGDVIEDTKMTAVPLSAVTLILWACSLV